MKKMNIIILLIAWTLLSACSQIDSVKVFDDQQASKLVQQWNSKTATTKKGITNASNTT